MSNLDKYGVYFQLNLRKKNTYRVYFDQILEITMSQFVSRYQASSVLHVHVVHLGAHIRTWEEQSTPENVFHHGFRPTRTIYLDVIPKNKNKYNFNRSTKISTTKKIH